jgi:hypothetical protein
MEINNSLEEKISLTTYYKRAYSMLIRLVQLMIYNGQTIVQPQKDILLRY